MMNDMCGNNLAVDYALSGLHGFALWSHRALPCVVV